MTVAAPVGAGLPRLLAGVADGGGAVELDRHLELHGPLPRAAAGELVAAVEASGLQGRGGAAFPVAVKLRAVAGRRRPIVVANGTEGEPASGKDKVLLRHAPHLVLDGAVAAAAAVGADEAVVAVASSARAEAAAVVAAMDARARAGLDRGVRLRLAVCPDGFVAGEETALVQRLSGRPAKPTFASPRPFERGVRGAPTLVQNVETLAHLALVARHGASWFRRLGTRAEPGSALVTVSGAVARPGVYEVPLGTRFAALVADAGGEAGPLRALLVGGYSGAWVDGPHVARLRLLEADLLPLGGRLGARAVVALPRSVCGVAETARVARYLADESAGQCGPCVHGLAAIAGALESVARCERDDPRPTIRRWLAAVDGRGACRHPDGAARFVASALSVFADEVDLHVRRGRCSGHVAPLLPVPRLRTRAR